MPKKVGGRPRKYKYKEDQAEKVIRMASMKMSKASIGAALGIPDYAVERVYGKEFREGRALGLEQASTVVMNLLQKDDLKAAQYYLDTSPEWNKKNITEISGPGGKPIEVDVSGAAFDKLAQLLKLK